MMTWVLATAEITLVPRLRTAPFLVEILAVTLIRVLAMALSGTLILFAYLVTSGQASIGQALPIAFGVVAPRGEMLQVYAFVLVASVVASFFMSLGRKLGPGVLSGWMLGRYRQPIQERRVVMFLDINDSTTIAEKVGDADFSSFVRDFMADLTQPILASRAEVSHYIGDEVVLTWRLTSRQTRVAWPRMIRLAQQRLDERSSYYMTRYGLMPSFKCGIHAGTVITTEVGVLKSDLVHHGDVLNVASRLAGLCKSQGCNVLATPDALEIASALEGFSTQSIGLLEVKGRRDSIQAVALVAAAGRSEPLLGPA
ncbi:CyaA Adenylate cyclase, family 3 (some proteins contain HAMP domain) [Fimbriimonadaceae bacterium]